VNAVSFIGKLRTKTGLTSLDLPTEAQWEYACRAGMGTALNTGVNLTGIESCYAMGVAGRYQSNGGSGYYYLGDASGGTAKVGGYFQNAWGLYDMHGNVSEWCLDWYRPYSGRIATDPTGPASATSRVLRGGSWNSNAGGCRSAMRETIFSNPSFKVYSSGFRVTRTLP
jgi:sulfatase modifying factor 1